MEDRRRLARNSLSLPAGSSAVTAPICIDSTYPYFRLFAKNAGTGKSSLKIEVLFYDAKGNLVNTKPYDYTTTSTAWQPTGTVKNQRLHTQDDGRCGAGRVPLHSHGPDRPLPDRRRLRRPVGSRLS